MKPVRAALALLAACLVVACTGTPTATPAAPAALYSTGGVVIASGHEADDGSEATTTASTDSTQTRSGYGIGSGN
jgi:type IV pilus biogenesis protein CpaD/CtpE